MLISAIVASYGFGVEDDDDEPICAVVLSAEAVDSIRFGAVPIDDDDDDDDDDDEYSSVWALAW